MTENTENNESHRYRRLTPEEQLLENRIRDDALNLPIGEIRARLQAGGVEPDEVVREIQARLESNG